MCKQQTTFETSAKAEAQCGGGLEKGCGARVHAFCFSHKFRMLGPLPPAGEGTGPRGQHCGRAVTYTP